VGSSLVKIVEKYNNNIEHIAYALKIKTNELKAGTRK
jgi:hypothetical protein